MTTLLCHHEQSSLGRLRSHRLLRTLSYRMVTMNSPLARRVASLGLCVVDLSSPFQAVLVFGALLARLYPMGVRRGTPPSCPQHGSASGEAALPPSLLLSLSLVNSPPHAVVVWGPISLAKPGSAHDSVKALACLPEQSAFTPSFHSITGLHVSIIAITHTSKPA